MLLRFAIRFNFINLPPICMGPLEINLFSLPPDISLLYNLKALNACINTCIYPSICINIWALYVEA